jgi:hypothetical protein
MCPMTIVFHLVEKRNSELPVERYVFVISRGEHHFDIIVIIIPCTNPTTISIKMEASSLLFLYLRSDILLIKFQ